MPTPDAFFAIATPRGYVSPESWASPMTEATRFETANEARHWAQVCYAYGNRTPVEVVWCHGSAVSKLDGRI